MKYLIVGLGNIGDEYKNTRHNIGFKILDALEEVSNVSFTTERYASIASAKYKGRTLNLIKPTTFMNLSGKAVNYWLQKYKVDIKNLLVITDDISLDFGTLRLREKGSDGGHNGMKDIEAVLGHNQYARLRFGVGNDFMKGRQADYVLDNWSSEENNNLDERIEQCIKIIQEFSTIGIAKTMSDFNGK
jgi:PTH1 family peptidyl-tRNA hydrolase